MPVHMYTSMLRYCAPEAGECGRYTTASIYWARGPADLPQHWLNDPPWLATAQRAEAGPAVQSVEGSWAIVVAIGLRGGQRALLEAGARLLRA